MILTWKRSWKLFIVAATEKGLGHFNYYIPAEDIPYVRKYNFLMRLFGVWASSLARVSVVVCSNSTSRIPGNAFCGFSSGLVSP
jgi:hypothetical protein